MNINQIIPKMKKSVPLQGQDIEHLISEMEYEGLDLPVHADEVPVCIITQEANCVSSTVLSVKKDFLKSLGVTEDKYAEVAVKVASYSIEANVVSAIAGEA